jgi:hypothetical protein
MNVLFKLRISEVIGPVSADLFQPDQPKAVITLAHGAGADKDHPFMVSLAKELFRQNIATLRFNFPFMERKKGRPDAPAVAQKTIEVAVKKAADLFPSVPIYVAGKSFGGRMSSQFVAASKPKNVKGIVFYGFPLHPAGEPGTERADHLKNIKLPMLFLQGTHDALAEWNLIEKVTKELSTATMIKIEGADHSFKKGKEDLIPLLAEATKSWIR